jgi:hypothetical protein
MGDGSVLGADSPIGPGQMNEFVSMYTPNKTYVPQSKK